MYRRAFRAAFPATVPVLMGYLAIGMAFGLMLQAIGYNFIWAFFMSVTIYAGSGQYLGVELLGTAATLGSVALLTFIINFRHLVYGLSLLEKFKGMGIRKLYMIFSLTDETYSVLCGMDEVPAGVDKNGAMFLVALLDQLYWVAGSLLGTLAGGLPLDFTGIDFSMTALFLVIFLEQWRGAKSHLPALDQWNAYREHLPALLGFGVTVVSLILLGPDAMLIPALCAIVVILLLLRVRLDAREENVQKEEV